MAKKPEIPRASGEMNFIMFSLRGGDETLQQSFRTISQALESAFSRSRPLPSKGQHPVMGLSDKEVEAEVVDDEPESLPPANGQETPTANKPRNRTAPKSLTVLDLNLNDGTPALKEFLAAHNPGDIESKRYLAIAFWFKNHFDTTQVTANHIHTAYRHMGWHTPKDPGIPLRDLKNKNGWMAKGTAPGSFVINHIGENEVNVMKASG